MEVLEGNRTTIKGITNLESYFVLRFQKLFRSLKSRSFKGSEDLVVPCIIEKENLILVLIPSKKEIKDIIKVMHNLKSLRLDGFMALYYKSCSMVVSVGP